MAININPAHKGRLHRALGVASGSPIPAGKLEKAAHSSSPALKKEAVFAENAKGFHHTGRHGGVLGKVAAGKMGHAAPGREAVKSDRGAFTIKG